MERPWVQVELPDIGDLSRRRPRAGWAFVVGPARQASESFVLEDLSDSDGAERMTLVSQVAADVIDREVLFSQGDDEVSEGIGLGCGLGSLGGGQEEGAAGILAEVMDQDTKAAGGITEAAGDFGTGEAVHEESAEGLVLAVGGVGGLEEEAGEEGRAVAETAGQRLPTSEGIRHGRPSLHADRIQAAGGTRRAA